MFLKSITSNSENPRLINLFGFLLETVIQSVIEESREPFTGSYHKTLIIPEVSKHASEGVIHWLG